MLPVNVNLLNVKSALFLLVWPSHLRAIYVPSTLPLRRVKGFLTLAVGVEEDVSALLLKMEDGRC